MTPFGAADRLPRLDALRAAAALGVMLSHLRFLWPGMPGWAAHGMVLLGQVAVEAFLVLSGFLLGRRLLAGMGAGAFVLRRALRIMPLLLLAVPAYLWAQPHRPGDPAAWQVLTLSAWFPGQPGLHSPFMGFAWALAAEWWAWMLLALVLAPVRRTAVPLLAAAWALLVGWRWWQVAAGVSIGDAFAATTLRLDPVLLGALAAAPGVAARPRAEWGVAAAGILGFAAAWLLAGPGHAPPWLLAGGFLALAVGMAALVRRLATGGAAMPAARALAAISYPLYLLHLLPVLLLGPQAGPGAAFAAAAAAAVAALLLAALAHAAVERPMLRLAARLSPAGRPGG